MKKILLVFIGVFCFLTCYSQGFLGKTTSSVKQELIKGGIRDFDNEVAIRKENGFTRYWWQQNKTDFYAYFNDKGICVLESVATFNESTARGYRNHITSNSKYYFYECEAPSQSNSHKFIEEKISAELTVSKTPYYTSYNFWFFKLDNKADVLKFFTSYINNSIIKKN